MVWDVEWVFHESNFCHGIRSIIRYARLLSHVLNQLQMNQTSSQLS